MIIYLAFHDYKDLLAFILYSFTRNERELLFIKTLLLIHSAAVHELYVQLKKKISPDLSINSIYKWESGKITKF